MTELNREMVEKVCRALCLHRGQDPDEMIQAGNPIGEPADYPAWMFGMPEVRTILTAILPDLREQHYAKCTARIVGWLRGPAFSSRHPEDAAFACHVAAAIDRGDHITKEGE